MFGSREPITRKPIPPYLIWFGSLVLLGLLLHKEQSVVTTFESCLQRISVHLFALWISSRVDSGKDRMSLPYVELYLVQFCYPVTFLFVLKWFARKLASSQLGHPRFSCNFFGNNVHPLSTNESSKIWNNTKEKNFSCMKKAIVAPFPGLATCP